MKTNPSLVKQKLPLGKGDAWIEVTSSHFAFVDFRAHPHGIECLRVPTLDKSRKATMRKELQAGNRAATASHMIYRTDSALSKRDTVKG
jgi:hypothetical protein